MKPLKIVLSCGLAVAASAALALPSYLTAFKQLAKPPAGSALAKAGCTICHTSAAGGALNPYGKDISKAKGAGKPLTAAVLQKTASLDSDKDGVKNGAEIKAGTLPGDAKSKPRATKPKPGKKPAKKHVTPSHHGGTMHHP